MHRRKLLVGLAGAISLISMHVAAAHGLDSAQATSSCLAINQHNFLELPDAPTHINSAVVVPATADVPEHCEIDATVAPQVGVALSLPTTSWNERILMQGCGGTCGVFSTRGCYDMLARNYAVFMTDMGHRGGRTTAASWADHNLEGVIDFGYRATHVATIAAKAITEAFYGEAAHYAYFRGCSTGGRQAMVEAERFPGDFDGIIAIAPPLDETGDTPLHLGWSARAANERSGRPILTESDVRRVHAAVLLACQSTPSIDDGIVQNPLECHWQPSQLACAGSGRTSIQGTCMSAEKVAALKKIYDGAHDASGHALFAGGMPLGSELAWLPWFISTEGKPAQVLDPNWLVSEFMRYLMFYEPQKQGITVFDFDYEHDVSRMALMEAFYNAQNPDLRRFKQHGGKLILVHGLADPLIPPALSIDYYDNVTRLMGGAQQTEDFFRLYLVPGMQHCIGGDTADAIDYVTALEHWVEHGEPPDALLAHHVLTPQTLLNFTRFPVTTAQWDWARPVYPYPSHAVWTGNGRWQDPENWQPAAPLPQ